MQSDESDESSAMMNEKVDRFCNFLKSEIESVRICNLIHFLRSLKRLD